MFDERGSLEHDQDRLWGWLERRRRDREMSAAGRLVEFRGRPVTPGQLRLLDWVGPDGKTLAQIRGKFGHEVDVPETIRNLLEVGMVDLGGRYAVPPEPARDFAEPPPIDDLPPVPDESVTRVSSIGTRARLAARAAAKKDSAWKALQKRRLRATRERRLSPNETTLETTEEATG